MREGRSRERAAWRFGLAQRGAREDRARSVVAWRFRGGGSGERAHRRGVLKEALAAGGRARRPHSKSRTILSRRLPTPQVSAARHNAITHRPAPVTQPVSLLAVLV
ncbi:hypothetical protein E2562_032645 [Oryza meyeriana var. granulata]|uniref:Uncharacterized protein n=1 Tax=Oryza meyeriana var. granulata TaxID=110450 RepID=A0A6G1CIT6_9ORYZ|nr:hypothetical protein E2562_032645 [Oryza meyeriana var. granulata]